jgi:hypothetical protein
VKGCDDGLVGVVGEVQGARTIGVGLEGLNAVVNYRVGVQMLTFISSLFILQRSKFRMRLLSDSFCQIKFML